MEKPTVQPASEPAPAPRAAAAPVAPSAPPTIADSPAAKPNGMLASLAEDPASAVETYTELIVRNLLDFGPRVLGSLLLLIAAWVFASWVRRAMVRSLLRTKLDVMLVKFTCNVTRWIIVVFALITSAGTLGINTTGFAAALAAAGFAVGFALQGNLGNLASGVLLMIFRPFKIGDVVNVAGHIAVVDGIDLFTTYLDTPDNRRIIVPNGQIFGGVIENMTHHPRRRADVNVGVAYSCDLDRTRAVLEQAAKSVVAGTPGALADPPPAVLLVELGPSSVNWTVRVWAESRSFFPVRQATVAAVKKSLDAAGLTIPFPQMDVYLRDLRPRDSGLPAT